MNVSFRKLTKKDSRRMAARNRDREKFCKVPNIQGGGGRETVITIPNSIENKIAYCDKNTKSNSCWRNLQDNKTRTSDKCEKERVESRGRANELHICKKTIVAANVAVANCVCVCLSARVCVFVCTTVGVQTNEINQFCRRESQIVNRFASKASELNHGRVSSVFGRKKRTQVV